LFGAFHDAGGAGAQPPPKTSWRITRLLPKPYFLSEAIKAARAMQIDPDRKHQVEAHGALVEGLRQGDRVQAHMCCGSGKTFTQAFLAQSMIDESDEEAPTIVCYVPNRDLIHQNARNFRKIFGDSVDYLGVCSPQENAQPSSGEEDEWSLPITTDAEVIGSTRSGKKPRIIFSTYQSAETLKDGLMDAVGNQDPVLLGLFDEAHRTAGEKTPESLFAFGLFEEKISIEKRAFFTATPRISEKAKPTGNISMADPDLYGPTVYEYSFRDGVRDGHIVDYDLWAPVIDKKELDRIASERGVGEEGMRELVSELALAKVMEETGQSRFLTYHRYVKNSKAFAGRLKETYEPLGFTIGHIDGSTSGKERAAFLEALSSGDTILTNCKAFVEGVDAPGLQGVVFVDAKSSMVDLVQAVGRASRVDPNDPHKKASVVVPLVVDSNDPRSIAKQAKDQGFGTLIEVVEALRANDNGMAEVIREASREMGRTGSLGVDTDRALPNLKVLGVGEGFTGEEIAEISKSVTLVSLTGVKDSFAERVGQLEQHLVEHGEMPTTKSDAKLNRWIQKTRNLHREGRLDQADAEMLDQVEGFSWIGPRAKAPEIAEHVEAFYERSRRMPDRMSDSLAEQDLGRKVRTAELHFLHNGEKDRLYGSRTSRNEGAALKEEMLERGLLMRGREGHIDPILGQIQKVANPKPGEPEFEFRPLKDPRIYGGNYVSLFETGHKVAGQAIGLHLSREDREKVEALDGHHKVTLELDRAGMHKNPLRDGKILSWKCHLASRGEKIGQTKTVSFLINRLKDRKLSGLPPYEMENLVKGRFTKAENATNYSHIKENHVPIEHVMRLAAGVRKAAARGDLKTNAMAQLDKAPGFSWVDSQAPEGFMAAAVEGIVKRHGPEILSDPRARRGDNGLANTLKSVDHLLSTDGKEKPSAEEIDKLKKAGYFRPLAAYSAATRRQASQGAQAANMDGKMARAEAGAR